MWCTRVDGLVVVGRRHHHGETGSPTTGRVHRSGEGRCELIEALSAVTNWRREGEFVRLIGPKTLVFECRRTEQS